ncbi:hypothetical protein PAV_141p01100 (plasmid) [Paenibacillus alvei DSM 29]|nr:hypothetical protein PAV_141p01100 [Paenibacillus alvei DSM 29]
MLQSQEVLLQVISLMIGNGGIVAITQIQMVIVLVGMIITMATLPVLTLMALVTPLPMEFS